MDWDRHAGSARIRDGPQDSKTRMKTPQAQYVKPVRRTRGRRTYTWIMVFPPKKAHVVEIHVDS